jgi:BirA family biotin operon repressor/biotin-[acetyl-CoA-carboxylase] ligase
MKNFRINFFKELESTNSYALLKAGKEFFDCDVIVAERQNAGRGRLSRSWVSPIGNLYFSLILQPKIAAQKLSEISFVASASLRLTLEKIGNNINPSPNQPYQGKASSTLPQGESERVFRKFEVENKWPNDVLINKKKVAGILLESDLQTGFVVLGIGVNVVSNPQNVMFEATNLKEFGAEILPQELLQKFLQEFDLLFQNYLDFGFKKTRNIWLEKAFSLHEKIRINLESEIIEGVFVGIDEFGNLLLQQAAQVRKISVGDVS